MKQICLQCSVKYMPSAQGIDGEFFTGTTRSSFSKMKGLLLELSNLQTCIIIFLMRLLFMKLMVMQNDRVIAVKIYIYIIIFFQMECDYAMNLLYRE